jgi:hypothetical protein
MSSSTRGPHSDLTEYHVPSGVSRLLLLMTRVGKIFTQFRRAKCDSQLQLAVLGNTMELNLRTHHDCSRLSSCYIPSICRVKMIDDRP